MKRARPNRFLPKWVSSHIDQHGKEWLRFRRTGYASRYFTAAFGTKEFGVEYEACKAGKVDQVREAIERTAPGSIGELKVRYFAVPERLGPSETTQTKVRRIICDFCDGRLDWPLSGLSFEHIDAIISAKKVKTIGGQRGKRHVGGVEAARKLRKELIRMFDFAIKAELMATNPARQSERVKVESGQKSKGFYSWTEDDIAQYRERHALGTKARLALELLLWTDQRRIDTIHLGRQHIERGRFKIHQTKTGKLLYIKIAPQLAEAVVAMPADQVGALCFLISAKGTPFTNGSFGNWFRKRCVEAGLYGCTAHGLRKATMRRMAELDMGNQTMKAISGHTKDDEVARYTEAANQIRMGDAAIDRLAAWELSNPVPTLDKAVG